MKPTRAYRYYAGIDPGSKGAIAVMNAAATSFKVWKMPSEAGEINLPVLRDIFRYLKRLPDVCLGIEWPNTWAGQFADNVRHAENFGKQKGTLEAFAFMHQLEYFRLAPASWKGRLGLNGKDQDKGSTLAAGTFAAQYPGHDGLVRGPRGGLLDGPLDALLMAHYLRAITGVVADVAARGSVEHMAAVLSMGKGRRNRRFGIS